MEINDIAAKIGSGQALNEVAGKLGISHDQAQAALQGVLQHVSDGGAVENVVEGVAAKAGIDPAKVQQFLPSVMGLIEGHAETAGDGALSGVIGTLRSSPIAGLLSAFDADKDGSIVDDALGMAKGLFGRKDA